MDPHLGFGGCRSRSWMRPLLSGPWGNGGDQEMGLENQINPRAAASAESPNPDQPGVKWVASSVPRQSRFTPAVAWLSKAERSKPLEKSWLHPPIHPAWALPPAFPPRSALSIPNPKGIEG